MKIKCSMTVTDDKVDTVASAINPDNNLDENKKGPYIDYFREQNKINYTFQNFEKISTLRFTLDDLLTHLGFSLSISKRMNSTQRKKQ